MDDTVDSTQVGDMSHVTGAAIGPGAQSSVLQIEHVDRLELSGAPQRPPAPLRTRTPDPRAARLVGRTDELKWVCGRLKAGDAAAIAGVRGIGKTELAIAAARALEDHFDGRVMWLDCGPNDAYAIQERMAAALGTALEGDDLQARADTLALAFRGQPPTLVVLDDVRRRHLADFASIAPPRPPCALLVTSRRSDLPLPDAAIWRLQVLSPTQSRKLLASLVPHAWLKAEPGAASAIVELLEHIPLALSLAARRARRIAGRRDASAQHPLAALLDELRARRIQVLNQGEDPGRPDLSVVITFDASTADLDAADQARLRKLGAFARGEFELPALQAVWDDEEGAARAALERLGNAGLVEEVGQDVWWMHDLLREYARDRLEAAPDEAGAARLAHAAYWQGYLDNAKLLGVEDWRALAARRPEVELAAGWLLADWGRAPGLAAELAVAISQAYQFHIFPRWEVWLAAGLAAAEAGGQRNSARRLQRSLGEYWWGRGEVSEAQRLLQASLATARELLERAATDDETEAAQQGVAVTLGDIARLKAQSGDVAGALMLHQEELAVYQKLGDVRERAVVLSDIARLKAQAGDAAGALALYQEILDIFHKLGDVRSRAVTLGHIARLKEQGGDVAGALALYQEIVDIFQKLGDVRSRAVAQFDMADLLRAQEQPAEAERLYRDSLEICRRIGDAEGTFATLARLGQLALEQGRRAEALPLLQEARQGFEAMGFTPWLAAIDQSLALTQGDSPLDGLVVLVRAARAGDDRTAQRAGAICLGQARSGDAGQLALGRSLLRLLAGNDPEAALADLPEDMRTAILAALQAAPSNDED